MVARDRTKFILRGPGYSERKITTNPPVHVDVPQTGTTCHKWWSRCEDTSGDPLHDHPLTITERDNRELVPMDGFVDQGGGSYIEYKNYLGSAQLLLLSHQSISIPSVGTRATTLRARTNPSREEVSIPNFVRELKDLPRMIKGMKDLYPLLKRVAKGRDKVASDLASQYLGYEFGWKPLVSDISQLLQFQSQVDRRILELNRLYSGTGLKRRLNLFDASVVDDSNVVLDSSLGTTFRVRKTRVTRKRSWGTIRWRPTVVPKDIGHQALGRQARRLVHGMDHLGFDAVQAWNALPFTWLADWFGNFGEYLEAHRNDVPAAPTGPCNIMTLTETYEVWQRTDSVLKITGGDGRRVLRTKERAQSSGTLSVGLSFVTARQFSILAALNLQRKRR